MDLKLTAEEASLLAEILGSARGDLRMEIADTDRKRMRDQLKERERLLTSLLAQLGAQAVPAGAAWPYEPPPDVDEEH